MYFLAGSVGFFFLFYYPVHYHVILAVTVFPTARKMYFVTYMRQKKSTTILGLVGMSPSLRVSPRGEGLAVLFFFCFVLLQ